MSIRGLKNHAGVLFSVKDDTIYQIDNRGFSTACGILSSKNGPVDMESTQTQMVVNDGTFVYVYNPTTLGFVTAIGAPGGNRILSIDQRIVGLVRGTNTFVWSALADATSWDTLDFAAAETTPREIIGCIEQDAELYFLKPDITEIWYPNTAGDPDVVYKKSNTTPHYGLLAPQTLRKSPLTIFWLGCDDSGSAQVLAMRGHQVQPLSNRALEERLTSNRISQATAFVYTDGSESYYCLNVPGLDTTWCYNEKWGEWHERADTINGKRQQWRPTCHAFAYGQHYFGDASGNLWILDPTVNTYGSDPKVRQRICPVVSKPDQANVTYRSMEIVCDKGQGGQALVRWSDDNGANWRGERFVSLGAVGRFTHRAKTHAMGQGRNRVYDISVADDVSWNPTELCMDMA